MPPHANPTSISQQELSRTDNILACSCCLNVTAFTNTLDNPEIIIRNTQKRIQTQVWGTGLSKVFCPTDINITLSLLSYSFEALHLIITKGQASKTRHPLKTITVKTPITNPHSHWLPVTGRPEIPMDFNWFSNKLWSVFNKAPKVFENGFWSQFFYTLLPAHVMKVHDRQGMPWAQISLQPSTMLVVYIHWFLCS